MKIKASYLLTLATGALFSLSARAQNPAEAPLPADEVQASGEVTVDQFYNDDTLAGTGRWVEVDGYGRCWQPTAVAAGWRPYTVGAWHTCNDGWTFASDEAWAGITYHYGRWTLVADSGWFWVPGTVWGPSWVSWRYGHGYVGWAPLSPECVVDVNVGVSDLVEANFGINTGWYSFCNVQDFGCDNVSNVICDRGRNVSFFDRTANITRISCHNSHVFAGGPNIHAVNGIIQSAGKQQIGAVHVAGLPANQSVKSLATATNPQPVNSGKSFVPANSNTLLTATGKGPYNVKSKAPVRSLATSTDKLGKESVLSKGFDKRMEIHNTPEKITGLKSLSSGLGNNAPDHNVSGLKAAKVQPSLTSHQTSATKFESLTKFSQSTTNHKSTEDAHKKKQ